MPQRPTQSADNVAETTYTLTCLDLSGGTQTKTATVRILPTFQEQ